MHTPRHSLLNTRSIAGFTVCCSECFVGDINDMKHVEVSLQGIQLRHYTLWRPSNATTRSHAYRTTCLRFTTYGIDGSHRRFALSYQRVTSDPDIELYIIIIVWSIDTTVGTHLRTAWFIWTIKGRICERGIAALAGYRGVICTYSGGHRAEHHTHHHDALLRSCDLSAHTVAPWVTTHRRTHTHNKTQTSAFIAKHLHAVLFWF